MSHSFTKVWIHGVFSTKDRIPIIKKDFENALYSYIQNLLENELDFRVKIINGMSEHLHILFLLNPNYALKDVFHRIKGSSSHWISQENFIKEKFAWQTGYSAFSVSESKLNDVEKYIQNQKEHHKKITFQDEYEAFMKKYGFNILGNG